MKNATKFCIITIVIGMLLAFTIFTLFANGMLTLDTSSPFLNILILFAGAMLVALLTGSLAAKNEPRLREAYNCCGNLAAIGGACLTLAAEVRLLWALPSVFSFLYCFWAESCVFFMLIFLSVPFPAAALPPRDRPIHVRGMKKSP